MTKDKGVESSAKYEHDNTGQSICTTKYCIDVASAILKSRDLSVNPCENFYVHACGLWEKNNPIPKTEVAWSEDHKITERTYKRIKDILEESCNDIDIKPIYMAKKFYQTCMDTETIGRRGIEPLLEILNRTGGWPMAMPTSEWDLNKTSWQEIDKYYMTLTGDSAFYNVEYERDERNTSRNILTIDQDVEHPLSGKKKMPDLIYDFNDDYMNGIEKVVQVFAKIYGHRLHRPQLIKDISDIVLLEIGLITIIEEEKRNRKLGHEHTIMSIKELQTWYDSFETTNPTAKINFLEVIQHVFKLGDIDIDESEPIVVYNEECLHKLAKLLEESSTRIIVNYIQWNMIHRFLYYTTQQLSNIKFDMYFAKYNITEQPQRWKFCLSAIEMKDALSYIFVKRYISHDVIESVTDMLNGITDELKIRIGRSEWIKQDVKTFMKEKLDSMVKQIGYPKWYNNETYLIERYKGLTIGSDFFENVLKYQQYGIITAIKEFRQRIDRTDWLDFPMTVNAFYSEDTNTIILPAAELQDPFFTESFPDAINYGVVGFVIGHELSHSFDNDGIEHDKDGNKVSWVFNEISEEYNKRAVCFIDQFNNYNLSSVDETGVFIKLDGNLTEDENIADSMGIQLALAAYNKAQEKTTQFKLPGLEDLSNDQLFFLSFANAWCSAAIPQYESDTVNNDEHSPSRYRVIGALSNMRSFSKTFQCPTESPMNPPEKCSLWK